jgi:hypothetical protein
MEHAPPDCQYGHKEIAAFHRSRRRRQLRADALRQSLSGCSDCRQCQSRPLHRHVGRHHTETTIKIKNGSCPDRIPARASHRRRLAVDRRNVTAGGLDGPGNQGKAVAEVVAAAREQANTSRVPPGHDAETRPACVLGPVDLPPWKRQRARSVSRYFFTIRGRDRVKDDPHGTNLPDVAAALSTRVP